VHPPTEPSERLTAFGNQLIEIHLWLREELAELRHSLGTPAAGPRDLRAHCLTFCSALTRHHTGEDGGAFRVLAEQAPELRPVLAELAEDHRVVATLLRRVEDLVAGAGPDNAHRVRDELDGLAALLESHFTYEEKKLVRALNALAATAGTEDLLGAPAPVTQSPGGFAQ
jgi:hypothetical protein